ncbi:MAG: phosphodiester glycosidase family protein [Anaerolineae bacterium]
MTVYTLAILGGVVLALFGKQQLRAAGLVLLGAVVLALLSRSTLIRSPLRPQPEPRTEPLAPGVTYHREPRTDPRPIVIHRVTLALDAVTFFVTPPEPTARGGHMPARTTCGFVRDFPVDLAINGDGFRPGVSLGPFYQMPLPGGPIAVVGDAASTGDLYSGGGPGPTLYLSAENEVGFGSPRGPFYNAISGREILVRDGRSLVARINRVTHPRTAVGLDRDTNTLILLVVDGRQPTVSVGVTVAELAELFIEYGAEDALNLDGGGSSALALRTDSGCRTLNTPVDGGLVGQERPVANHLGVIFMTPATGDP